MVLTALCGIRMVNSETASIALNSGEISAHRDSQAVYKADFIDDVIDIITGGGDDDEEDPTVPQPRQ